MKKNRTNPYRLLIQFTILGLLIFMGIRLFLDKNYAPDFEAYCPFGGVQALSSFLINNTLACSMTSVQIAMGLMLILAIVIFSKLFCSFICPIGTFSEWLGKLGEKLDVRYTIKGIADKILRALKYILLFITIYFTITSSELFCKIFDPYYAVASGYNADVSIFWATLTIAVVIFGSFYIRLFWCKYLCPLGALSNIFSFFLLFLGLTGIYILILFLGVQISFVWLLAALCAAGYILEVLSIEKRIFPLLKITRNPETCTNCKLCTKACPQAIDVASAETVKHVDCNMCGDCVHVCPEKDTLTINKKGRKWLPTLVLVIIIVSGILIGRTFEIPTISEYWGKKSTKKEMAIYYRSGLKNIKCYGSSITFANQMKTVKGVEGVSTFVGRKAVKIWYNPQIIDTIGIQKSIFVPIKYLLRQNPSNSDSISVYNISVDKFFDPYDNDYLANLLLQNEGVYGFISEFDCPIRITIFTSSNGLINGEMIIKLIEQKQLKITYEDSSTQLIDLNYRVKKIEKQTQQITWDDFVLRIK